MPSHAVDMAASAKGVPVFLTETFQKILLTFLISMGPLLELRAGLPYGIISGLSLPVAASAAVIGNMIPVPFIIFFIRSIFTFMRRHMPKMDKLVTKMENKAEKHRDTIDKYGYLGLLLLVAVPLPGTGAWTGSLVAALFDLDKKRAIPCIFLGVIIAAIIMTVVTKLGIFAFF